MEISGLLTTIANRPDCIIVPPCGLPLIAPQHRLPSDVYAFYLHCGGLKLFTSAAFPTEIVAPEKLQLANPVIFNNVSAEDLDATRDDPSWSWYLIGVGPNSQYITIDFHPTRLGQCYNSFWIKHPGNSEIIAHSFTELLSDLLATKGEYYSWDA
jgi:antitoxin YokJ